MISGHSHASLGGTSAVTASDRRAVNDSQNAPVAINAVMAVAIRWVARAAACARNSTETPCTAASSARGAMVATAAATMGRAVQQDPVGGPDSHRAAEPGRKPEIAGGGDPQPGRAEATHGDGLAVASPAELDTGGHPSAGRAVVSITLPRSSTRRTAQLQRGRCGDGGV